MNADRHGFFVRNCEVGVMKLNPWDADCDMVLFRRDPITDEFVPLERGVNFFVLALEALGARTCFSCEGHPYGFYVSFICDYDVAWKIAKLGYLTVELGRDANEYVIHQRNAEESYEHTFGIPWGEGVKVGRLRMVASVWMRNFGKRLCVTKQDGLCIYSRPAPFDYRFQRPLMGSGARGGVYVPTRAPRPLRGNAVARGTITSGFAKLVIGEVVKVARGGRALRKNFFWGYSPRNLLHFFPWMDFWRDLLRVVVENGRFLAKSEGE